jgi:tetratricopeptide repeat protein
MMFQRLCAAAVLSCLLLCVAPVHAADDYAEIQKLYRQGKRDEALQRLDAHLASQPRDARARFLKGSILVEQKRTAEAIAVFTELTQDYPELAEPYNNLGVLYASEGNYARAREALEMAVRTNPKYATAQENLGDVYAALAARAYDHAVQLDGKNTAARTKLALTRQVFPPQTPAAALSAQPEEQAAIADTLPPGPPIPAPPPEPESMAFPSTAASAAEAAQSSTPPATAAPAAGAQSAAPGFHRRPANGSGVGGGLVPGRRRAISTLLRAGVPSREQAEPGTMGSGASQPAAHGEERERQRELAEGLVLRAGSCKRDVPAGLPVRHL